MKVYKKINKCRICNSISFVNVIDLKNQYIQGAFIKKKFTKPYLKKIPLKLILCLNCSLAQLLHTTNKNILYRNYWYESGINSTTRIHLKLLAKNIANFLKVENKQFGCQIINIPPSITEKIEKFGKTFDQLTKETVKTFLKDSKKSNFSI